jgi:transcriptional regulator with XRE-family HTH domain
MNQDFATWLQNELDRRGWIQADLLTSAQARGYPLTSPQLSRILNREQQAGIESAIAIAQGLGVSRETVFRARGWLLSDTSTSDYVPDPDNLALMQDLEALPPSLRTVAYRATRALVDILADSMREQG